MLGNRPKVAFVEYLSRIFDFSQMDFQYVFSQMVALSSFRPQEVYNSTSIRNKIKNQWARGKGMVGLGRK
jgi:hypothetical protein